MNLEEKNINEIKQNAIKSLETAENKSVAIVDVIEKMSNDLFGDIKERILAEYNASKSDADYKNHLGLRSLSKEEKNFYQMIKDVKQSFTGKNDVYIPSTTINIALDNARTSSKLLEYINLAPAGIQDWIVEEHSGTAVWGKVTDKIKGELTSKLDGLKVDINKLTTYLVIPKAISELADEWVDRYFIAILTETIIIGAESGCLTGNGKDAPIGVYNKIELTNEDGTHKEKDINTNITDFSPKGLAPVKKYLTNDGKRVVDKMLLICNPADEADYVAPALYDQVGNMISSFKNLEVIPTIANPQGKAVFMLPFKYTLGFDKYSITKYDQTLAMDDADLLIGKVNGNGRANDDNVAYVFDVTKLEEFVYRIKDVAPVATNEVAGA